MTREDGHPCPTCGARFARRPLVALHRGRVHPGTLDEDARAAFEAALEEEEAWLSRFRSHLAGALAALSVLLFYVGVVLSSYVLRANPAFIALPAPGILGFAIVTYWLVYRHRLDVETRETSGSA